MTAAPAPEAMPEGDVLSGRMPRSSRIRTITILATCLALTACEGTTFNDVGRSILKAWCNGQANCNSSDSDDNAPHSPIGPPATHR